MSRYYYRARYYDPAAGRFLSEDPIGFDGGVGSFYEYSYNDPGNLIDSFGLQALPKQVPLPPKPGPVLVPDPTKGEEAAFCFRHPVICVLGFLLLDPPDLNPNEPDPGAPKKKPNPDCDKDKKDDLCRIQYEEDLRWCLETFSDVAQRSACVQIASLNFQRCKQGLEPLKRDPRDYPKPKKSPVRKPNE